MTEIAEVLARALGRRVSAPDMTEEEALAAGMPPMGAPHEWVNVVGQPGRPQYARDLGIPLTSFDGWAREHLRAAARPVRGGPPVTRTPAPPAAHAEGGRHTPWAVCAAPTRRARRAYRAGRSRSRLTPCPA